MVSGIIKGIIGLMIVISIGSNVLAGSMSGAGTGFSAAPVMLDLGGDSTIYDYPKYHNTTNNSTLGNSTSSYGDEFSGYASLGDIIKAGDWVALEKYTNSINATTPITGSDTPSSQAQQDLWDAYFKDPSVITISCSCS